MTLDPDTQSHLDIAAFVNGQLDDERRFAVSEYLSRHPDLAAGVMAEMSLTEGLKLTTARMDAVEPPTLRLAAGRLSDALAQQHTPRRWGPIAAAFAMFAIGWTSQGLVRDVPFDPALSDTAAVMDMALDAQEAIALRTSLSDELGPLPRETAEVAERLGIALPELPKNWTTRAIQVVATPERPGVALLISTPDLGEIMLFGVTRNGDRPDLPAKAVNRDGRVFAYFERDRTAYVLVDNFGTATELRHGAETLRRRFG